MTPEKAKTLLAEHSPPLAPALERRPELLTDLFDRDLVMQPVRRQELAGLFEPSGAETGPESEDDFLRRIRLAKEAAFVRLALRDLADLADLTEITAGLADLADLALTQALDRGLPRLLERRKLPPWPQGEPLFFTVLALGKHGGRELNYSSDIDLIYLHEPDLWPFPEALSAQEAAGELAGYVSRSLSKVTVDGLVFRVDLELRPLGRDGPAAPTATMALNHYLYRAAEWERLALLKVRPAAGNLELGGRFHDDTRPFVFRRHLDYTAIEELRELKDKIAGRKRTALRRGFNLKLDNGGIRQCEFFVQTLQLIFGGRRPDLRQANTLAALKALRAAELITDQDRTELTQSYTFLRQAEHRLQLHGLHQTQVLPTDRAALDRLGRSMGSGQANPGQAFLEDLEVYTDRVRTRFEALLGGGRATDGRELNRLTEVLSADEGQALEILKKNGFQDPKRALNGLKALTADDFLPQVLSRQRRLLAQVIPALLDRILVSPDPDSALTRLERFLAVIGPKTGLFMMLRENPAVLDLLVKVMASSAYLSRVLINHPGLLDGLIDPRSIQIKDRARLAGELTALLAAGTDEEDRIGLIRRFKAEETVRIAVRDLAGDFDQARVSDQLSDLAEAVLTETVAQARTSLERRFTAATDGPLEFAVFVLGKLGGRELSYHSDLDVLFLYRGREADRALVKGELGPAEFVVRWAQRIITQMSAVLPEGPGYEIDARLRPGGGKGPLVVSLEKFREYHRRSDVWERMALVKARPVCGSESFLEEAGRAIEEAVYGRDLPADWVDGMVDLQARMTAERGATRGRDLKFSPGGLVDVEFTCQMLQLRRGRGEASVRLPGTLAALAALNRIGALDQDDHHVLAAAYDLLRTMDHRLRLIYDRHGDKTGYRDRDLEEAGFDPAEYRSVVRAAAETCTRIKRGL